MWDLSSQIRDQTCIPCIGRQSLNHWTTRDILWNMFFKLQNPWVLVTQSCPTLCNPTDYSLSGSPVHGLLQARILEWIAFSSTKPIHAQNKGGQWVPSAKGYKEKVVSSRASVSRGNVCGLPHASCNLIIWSHSMSWASCLLALVNPPVIFSCLPSTPLPVYTVVCPSLRGHGIPGCGNVSANARMVPGKLRR